MRATTSGERTAFDAEGSVLAAEAGQNIGDDTTTGSPGSDDAIEEEIKLVVAIDVGSKDTSTAETPLRNYCWFAWMS